VSDELTRCLYLILLLRNLFHHLHIGIKKKKMLDNVCVVTSVNKV